MSVSTGRRTYLRSDLRRDQILACALEVFAAKGFHGSSIADICSRAGIGRATLYQYFEDKRDVLVALVDRIAQRVIDACAAGPRLSASLAGERAPTREQVLGWIEARYAQILTTVFEDAATARLLLRAARGCDGLVDQTLRKIDAHVIDVLETGIRRSLDAGLIRPCDPHLLACFIVGGLEKIVLEALEDDRSIEVAHVAHEAAMMQFHGLVRRKSSTHTEPPASRRRS
jgi:AcrR family transcriptional regulator